MIYRFVLIFNIRTYFRKSKNLCVKRTTKKKVREKNVKGAF